MFFVPVIPSSPPPPPSPRTRELAALLAKVLDEYKKAHPSLTGAEIRDALRAARASLGPLRGSARSTAVVAGAATAAALGIGVAVLQRSGGFDFESLPPIVILNLVVILLVALVVITKISR